jgi:CHAT domain-containing protein
MTHSLAQEVSVTCADCGKLFTAQVWLIVDAVERPDLLEKARQGTLHVATCPHCDHEGEIDSPLLLYRPDEDPSLLFSPARQTSVEQDRELVGALQERLGPAWRDEWAAQGLAGVPREFLPAALSEDPNAALKMAEQARERMERLREEDPEAYRQLEEAARQVMEAAPLLQTVQRFIEARTWDESRRAVEEHPELLTDEAGDLLGRLVDVARARGYEQEKRVIEEHRALLQRCQEVGIKAAFAEKVGTRVQPSLPDGVPDEAHQFLEAMASLSPEQRERLEEVSAQARAAGVSSPEELEAFFDAHPDVRAAMEEALSGVVVRVTGISAPPEFRDALRRSQEGEQRYLRTGDRAALDDATTAWEFILGHADFTSAPEHFQLAALNDASLIFLHRYRARGHLEDLNRSLTCLQQAVQRTPSDSPALPTILNNLGVGLEARYTRTGRLEDLEEAVRVHRQVVQRTPPDSPGLPGFLVSLGIGLSYRYARTGRLEDLEEAIRIYEQAVQCTPLHSPNLPPYLNELGTGLRDRYARTGRLEDLEGAIRVYRQAVEHTPPNSPVLPGYLSNLGMGLGDCYARTGRLEDLEEAIQVYGQAVERTPLDSLDLPMYLNNLGNGLIDRYARTRRLEDLEEAVRVYHQAVQRTPPDSPDLPMYLSSLGNGLRDHYIRTGRLEDLEEAVRVYHQAVQRTPPGSPDLPSRLTNLGNGLSNRYVRTERLEDLEEAVRVHRQAVQRTPPDSPDLPMYLNNLGTGLSDRYARTGRLEDLEEATGIYQQSLAAMDRAFLLSPVAYQLGQQARWTGLIARAAETHRQAGKIDQALAIAEGSKSRLLAALLGREELPAPPAVPRDLAERERVQARQLAALDAAELAGHGRASRSNEKESQEALLQRRQALLEELKALWRQMLRDSNDDPEIASYVALRRGDRPAWEDLARLATDLGSDTALLSLFTTDERTLLFVLRDGMDAPQVVDAELSAEELRYTYLLNYADEILNRRIHRAAGRPFTQRWRGLGLRLLAPLAPLLDGVDHLVIIPQGPLHLLPLHALPIDADGETLWDRFTISYIPAASVLDRLRRREPIVAGKATVLGYTPADPATPRGRAEQELFLGEAQAVGDQLRVRPLLNEEADAAHLRDALGERTLRLVHLSCHGRFHSNDPLRSGVLLADGPFTARQWMELRFQADLVALSACETGMSGSLGGDEMAGLSQALLYAGASSLLLGLWSVDARTTAALMVDFYERLWDEQGVKRTDEATALREAALALRDGQLLPPSGNLNPADPYYWAPFVLVGDWR